MNGGSVIVGPFGDRKLGRGVVLDDIDVIVEVVGHDVLAGVGQPLGLALALDVGPVVGGQRCVELLLVPEHQVSARKAPAAGSALERLLVGVRALVALQVLQTRERPGAH